MDSQNYTDLISRCNSEEEMSKVKLILKNKNVPDPYYGGENGFENGAKWSQKRTKWSPKGANREPKSDQNAPKRGAKQPKDLQKGALRKSIDF